MKGETEEHRQKEETSSKMHGKDALRYSQWSNETGSRRASAADTTRSLSKSPTKRGRDQAPPMSNVTAPRASEEIKAPRKKKQKTKGTGRESNASDGTPADPPCPVHPNSKPCPTLQMSTESKTGRRRCCANVCEFFGTLDEYHLLQWKIAFERKLMLGDVGVGLKKAVDFKYLFHKNLPPKDQQLLEMKGGTTPKVSDYQECSRSGTATGEDVGHPHYFVRGRTSRSSCPALSPNGFSRTDFRRKPIIPITCKQTSRVLNNSDVRVTVDIKTDEQPSPRAVPRLLPVSTDPSARTCRQSPGRIISWPLVGGLVIRSQKTDDPPSSGSSDYSVNSSQGNNWMSLRTSSRHSTSSYGSNTSEEDIWVPRSKT